MNRILIAISAALLWSAAMFGAGWAWRGDRAEAGEARQSAGVSAGEARAQADARDTEHQQAAEAQAAGDAADTRQEKIDADYQERLAAAVAGRDSELGRLRKLWGQCETDSLSGAAGAAAAAAEQDRLRLASAARAVRAVELAQSERDEAIDRYQALMPAAQAPTP